MEYVRIVAGVIIFLFVVVPIAIAILGVIVRVIRELGSRDENQNRENRE
jgi:hypothetical protein